MYIYCRPDGSCCFPQSLQPILVSPDISTYVYKLPLNNTWLYYTYSKYNITYQQLTCEGSTPGDIITRIGSEDSVSVS